MQKLQELPDEVVVLRKVIDGLPAYFRNKLLHFFDAVILYMQGRETDLDDIRLKLVYETFNSEATKRELKGLRRELEELSHELDKFRSRFGDVDDPA